MLIGLVMVCVVGQTAGTGHAEPADLEQARREYAQGEKAYLAGDYTEAVSHFEASHRLSGRVSILFDLAQCYRQLYARDQDPHSLRNAVELYRRYLDAAPPTAKQRAAAEKHHAELTKRLAAINAATGTRPDPSPPPPPPLPPPPPRPDPIADSAPPSGNPVVASSTEVHPPGRAKRIAGLFVGGVGVVTIAIGTTYRLVQRADCTRTDPCTATEWKRTDRAVTATNIVIPIGGVALVGGVVLYYLGYREKGVSIEPLADRGAAVHWSTAF